MPVSYRPFETRAQSPLVLLVPGGEQEAPWMTEWERRRADARRLSLGMWDAPHRNTWVNKLNLAIRRADRPVVLVAQGIACLAVAWWAEYEQADAGDTVTGALLVLPPDIDRPGADPRLARFGACPRGPLPFASFLVAGPDEPADLRHSLSQLARDWNASFVSEEVGAAEWPDGQWLVDRLIRRETGAGDAIPAVSDHAIATGMVHSAGSQVERAA
jgi:hypothetical protein